MSDESYSREELNTDTGSYSLDDEDQLQRGDTLEDPDVDDVLDEGYSPPDRARGSLAWGVTPYEESQDETIEQRIRQEVPDPTSAYGAPDNESGMDRDDRVGGDDQDAIAAEDDFVGDVGRRAGRLVAPDEGAHGDDEKDEVAQDVGIDGAGASAEEAAMHVEADQIGIEDLGGDDGAQAEGLSEATAYRIENDDEMNELDSLESPSDDRG